MTQRFSVFSLLHLAGFVAPCWGQAEPSQFQYEKWTVSQPVFQRGPQGTFDDVAVKDPSIVFYNEKYHLFYTAKSVRQAKTGAKYEIDLGYVSASSLEGLNAAKRTSFKQLVGTSIIAPQIFYFEPQRLWYLIAHTKVSGKPNLMPVYLTNPNIEDLQGWSKPEILQTGKSDDTFWIDFWVICDDTNAHLIYSNQKGAVLRMECPLKNFPHGFAQATEQVALTATGKDDTARWQIFEAQHVYHVKEPDQYLMLLECGYYEKSKNWFGDARSRFMIGMVAKQIQGPWTRIESSENEFLAQAKNLIGEDGRRCHYTQVSHPELIRSGYNQKLEIENYNLRILFQSFDGSKTPDGYDYNELPWELAVMRNY